MLIIHYNTAYKALNAHIDVHNKRTKELKDKVRLSVVATARELIRLYGASLVKANRVEKLDLENLPSLRTNNVQLAKAGHGSGRTIQRHLLKLKKAGIITKKVWHGSNASYEVWINPDILKIKESKPAKTPEELKEELNKIAERALEKELSSEKNTKCPHTETGNNKNNIVIEGVKVDKSDDCESGGEGMCDETIRHEPKLMDDAAGNDTGNATGNTERGNPFGGKYRGTGKKMRSRLEKKGAGGRASEADQTIVENENQLERKREIDFHVDLLWSMAKNTLYSERYLTNGQVEKAKAHLYEWYDAVSTERLSWIHQVYTERIALAHKYVKKDPRNRFITLPATYFDLENMKGFRGTKVWWEKQTAHEREVKHKLVLHAQVRRFLNNLKKNSADRIPPLKLFRDCEARIGKLGDSSLLEAFHAQVLKPLNQTEVRACA